jgi:nitrate reductase molybdenum cofactor assembly chaperone
VRPTADLHDALADLLEYPGNGHAARVDRALGAVAAEIPEAAADLEPLARAAREQTLGECEETYVRTFDGNTERALEVGWQVFGEQYARGQFLVRLRVLMRDAGVAESTELPDHLTNVLRLLGRMPEDEARVLIARAVEPSLRRIRKDLEDSNPYAGVLGAVAKAAARHAVPEAAAAGGTRP